MEMEIGNLLGFESNVCYFTLTSDVLSRPRSISSWKPVLCEIHFEVIKNIKLNYTICITEE